MLSELLRWAEEAPSRRRIFAWEPTQQHFPAGPQVGDPAGGGGELVGGLKRMMRQENTCYCVPPGALSMFMQTFRAVMSSEVRHDFISSKILRGIIRGPYFKDT